MKNVTIPSGTGANDSVTGTTADGGLRGVDGTDTSPATLAWNRAGRVTQAQIDAPAAAMVPARHSFHRKPDPARLAAFQADLANPGCLRVRGVGRWTRSTSAP